MGPPCTAGQSIGFQTAAEPADHIGRGQRCAAGLEKLLHPRHLRLSGIDGEVQRGERIAPDRQFERGGQRVEHIVRMRRGRRARELPDPRGRHVLARPVDRREVGRRARRLARNSFRVKPNEAEVAAPPSPVQIGAAGGVCGTHDPVLPLPAKVVMVAVVVGFVTFRLRLLP